jgi:hypothetical protein
MAEVIVGMRVPPPKKRGGSETFALTVNPEGYK